MKLNLTIDLDKAIADAKGRVDQYFSARHDSHRSEAHRRKREIAQNVQNIGAHVAPTSFLDEAERNGMNVNALAAEVLSKEDEFDARETERRKLVESVRAAKTLEEINGVLKNAGIGEIGNAVR